MPYDQNPTNPDGHRQRLRDRFIHHGLEGFQDYEIIELLLTLGTPRRDCKQPAKEALNTFGSLKAVLEAESDRLCAIKGIGQNNVFGLKIAQAVARRYLADRILHRDIVRSSNDVLEYLAHTLRDKNREIFIVLFLNGRNEILAIEEVFVGTLTTSAVYPREVVKRTLANDAAAVVLVHNHPSGNTRPSKDDLTITHRLKEALGTIDVAVHDHIIIAGTGYTSFAEQGLI